MPSQMGKLKSWQIDVQIVEQSQVNCPFEGRFGNNIIAQTTLPKYEDRLPHRKIQESLRRQHGLVISPATILDLTRRAADAVQSQYDVILTRIRTAPILYVDETSIDVQGEMHWIWAFTTPSESFVVIRKSRGMKVPLEVLTRRFAGITVCGGWKPMLNLRTTYSDAGHIYFENRKSLPKRSWKQFLCIKHLRISL